LDPSEFFNSLYVFPCRDQRLWGQDFELQKLALSMLCLEEVVEIQKRHQLGSIGHFEAGVYLDVDSLNHLLEILLNALVCELLSITWLVVWDLCIGVKPDDDPVSVTDSIALSADAVLPTRLLLMGFLLYIFLVLEIVGLLPGELMWLHLVASIPIGNVPRALWDLMVQQLIPFAVVGIAWPQV
jgi:hypothetical protein